MHEAYVNQPKIYKRSARNKEKESKHNPTKSHQHLNEQKDKKRTENNHKNYQKTIKWQQLHTY